MSDQYLWDGSGEPDRDIEMLERKLSVYKYEPRPLELPEVEPGRTKPTRPLWLVGVAAAVAILFALGAIFVTHRVLVGVRTPEVPVANNPVENHPSPVSTPNEKSSESDKTANNEPAPVEKALAVDGSRHTLRVARDSDDGNSGQARPAGARPAGMDGETARAPRTGFNTLPSPFEVETSSHIEKAQMLLRSFKNSDDTGEALTATIAFDRSQAQQILFQNILLRRAAEMRGDLPLEEVLGNLEPFLLDIANLPETASKDEVRTIRDRIRNEEIVTTLQAYAPPPARAW